MQQAILARFPDREFRVTLIWVDMLRGDNATSAREAARAFTDPRVRSFHDPGRRVGTAFAREVFAGYQAQAAGSLPAGDSLATHLRGRPADSPIWDAYFYYEPGTRWNDAPPRPARWIKQMMLDHDGRSLVWENDFARPPKLVDLTAEVGAVAEEWLSPAKQPQPTPQPPTADRAPERRP